MISLVALPVGTPTGVTTAATATELALTATAVTVVAATALEKVGFLREKSPFD